MQRHFPNLLRDLDSELDSFKDKHRCESFSGIETSLVHKTTSIKAFLLCCCTIATCDGLHTIRDHILCYMETQDSIHYFKVHVYELCYQLKHYSQQTLEISLMNARIKYYVEPYCHRRIFISFFTIPLLILVVFMTHSNVKQAEYICRGESRIMKRRGHTPKFLVITINYCCPTQKSAPQQPS